jgi:putative membrane protein
MRKINLLPIAFAIILMAAACQNENRNNRDKAATNVTDTTMDTTARAQMYTSDVDLQGNEKLFFLSAINGAMLDIEAGTMAERKTKDPLVKAFAHKMVVAATKANQNLELIAKGKGISPPTVLSEENLSQMAALKTVSGNLFDKTYVKLATQSLAAADLLLGKAATFKNEDIKTFAINSLSDIQQNYKEAVTLGKKLNISNQNNGNDLL